MVLLTKPYNFKEELTRTSSPLDLKTLLSLLIIKKKLNNKKRKIIPYIPKLSLYNKNKTIQTNYTILDIVIPQDFMEQKLKKKDYTKKKKKRKKLQRNTQHHFHS